MIVAFIDENEDELGVGSICAQLQVAPSTYYPARARPASARSPTDAAHLVEIDRVHGEDLRVCGAKKLHAAIDRRRQQRPHPVRWPHGSPAAPSNA